MSGGPAARAGHRTQGGQGEPEYFGDQRGGPAPVGGPPPASPSDGQTTAFRVPDPYGPEDGEYAPGNTYGGDRSAPAGPRLGWKALLSGMFLRPSATFLQMRDYPVWGPAVLITFLYGLLAIFGLDEPREEVINATLGSAIPYVLTTGVAVVVVGLILGAVTHTLARQFGGVGSWQPTVGLSMLIMSLTDAPRLLFALFLGGTAPLVQVLGWATWIVAGALFTAMVSRSHDLPWSKALGASAIQLVALLALIKLGAL